MHVSRDDDYIMWAHNPSPFPQHIRTIIVIEINQPNTTQKALFFKYM